MSLSVQLTALVNRIGAEFKNTNSKLSVDGTLASLQTTEKASIVASINEVHTQIVGILSKPPIINDTAVSDSSTYSAVKVNFLLEKLRAELMGTDEIVGVLDTIKEIATFVNQNKDLIDGLQLLAQDRVSLKAGQIITAEQKSNVYKNLALDTEFNAVNTYIGTVVTNIGDTSIDLVALFNSSLTK